jgi:hypothetical protein
MSPSPPKHRKLIAQARDKSNAAIYFRLVEIDQPEVCLLSDVTSLSFLLSPPLPLSGTSCNVQYSGSSQRETWSKSSVSVTHLNPGSLWATFVLPTSCVKLYNNYSFI